MIVYGTGGKELGEKLITNEKCPHCGEINKIYLHGFSRYVHLFWIPIFPYSKKTISICHNCENEIPKEQASASLLDKISLEKSSFKIPFYHFSGIILIALAVAWFKYSDAKHKEFVENRIEHVQKNDILVLKQSNKEYSFAKVDSVSENEVFFINSNYSYNQKPDFSDYEKAIIEKSDFYDAEIYYFTIFEIDSLYKSGELDIFE